MERISKAPISKSMKCFRFSPVAPSIYAVHTVTYHGFITPMDTLEHVKHLSPIAEEMGVSLYQRFTENDAARFLKLNIGTLKSLRQQRKVGFLQLPDNQVEYFGLHLLQFLMSANQSGSDTSHQQKKDRIVRMSTVVNVTGLSRTTIWRYEKEGIFPARVALGGGSIGWYESDVDQWIHSRRRLKHP